MINELERRVIGNLAIPRNATDLYLRLVADEHAPVGPDVPSGLRESGMALESEDEINKFLREEMEPKGLVVKINPVESAVDLAMDPPKSVTHWHEESKEIFARRLQAPNHKWRIRGDTWMMTDLGVEALQEPTSYVPDPTVDQVQRAINGEWARVGKDMAEDEFAHWLNLVLEGHPDMRGDLVLPMAGGASGWSDAFEVTILNQENQKTQAPALVDPWYMALSIRAITDADTGTTLDAGGAIPTYTGYARKSVASTDMATASGTSGSVANTSAITFAACTAGTSTIIAIANTSASTVGIMRKWGDVASTVISTTQTPATLAIGAYVTTAD